ncbi:MAG: hypothetical protein M1833_001083 [Piccolia ochrophora]|nr:MAG: hypothetical protein M1833_001083 [Piccolia ochrophora]
MDAMYKVPDIIYGMDDADDGTDDDELLLLQPTVYKPGEGRALPKPLPPSPQIRQSSIGNKQEQRTVTSHIGGEILPRSGRDGSVKEAGPSRTISQLYEATHPHRASLPPTEISGYLEPRGEEDRRKEQNTWDPGPMAVYLDEDSPPIPERVEMVFMTVKKPKRTTLDVEPLRRLRHSMGHAPTREARDVRTMLKQLLSEDPVDADAQDPLHDLIEEVAAATKSFARPSPSDHSTPVAVASSPHLRIPPFSFSPHPNSALTDLHNLYRSQKLLLHFNHSALTTLIATLATHQARLAHRSTHTLSSLVAQTLALADMHALGLHAVRGLQTRVSRLTARDVRDPARRVAVRQQRLGTPEAGMYLDKAWREVGFLREWAGTVRRGVEGLERELEGLLKGWEAVTERGEDVMELMELRERV